MMCSLLALATGLALGSQIAPTATGVARASVPSYAQRLQAWVQPQAESAPAPVRPLPALVDVDPTADAMLEGGRQPRMPRASREGLARAPR